MTMDKLKAIMMLYCIDLPDWVEWVAVDGNGDLHGYDVAPVENDECDEWILRHSSANNFTYIKHMNIQHDVKWSDTCFRLKDLLNSGE